MCILYVNTLIKVVNRYDLIILSMLVMGVSKKIGKGWVVAVSSIQFCCCLTLQSP